MKQDLPEISIGDKIFVKEGELQGAIGQIMSFDDNGNQVVFKPTNLEGFDDTLGISKQVVVKYFESGDCVKIVDGRYIGETAIVVKVDEDKSMPMIRLDETNRELHLNTSHLKMMNDKEKDDVKTVKKKAGFKNLNPIESKDSDVMYKVGDLIMFDYEKKMV
jgi:transcription antitermination factor NusG